MRSGAWSAGSRPGARWVASALARAGIGSCLEPDTARRFVVERVADNLCPPILKDGAQLTEGLSLDDSDDG